MSFHSRGQNAASMYSVSKLNKEIRSILEQGFASIQLTGEISNYVAPASGHWYFSLKDQNAQIKGAMWRGNNRFCQYQPKNGDQVIVTARVSVYEPRGDYQLIVEHMEPAGEGILKQQFETLKLKLASQGLFSSQTKQAIPSTVTKIGVVTSPTGAAIKDILTVLKRRAPQLEVIIYPAIVQGKEAHLQLIEKIELANARKEVDILIVGRGGGSLEDLWCFNEEQLAHCIYNSHLPIISAVGHEIDTTISDYVADVRAATPSAAAELVSPNKEHLIELNNDYKRRLLESTLRRIEHARMHISTLQKRLQLQHPSSQLLQQTQKTDELSIRLQRAVKQKINTEQSQLAFLQQKLHQYHPSKKINEHTHVLESLKQRLDKAMEKQQNHQQHQIAMLCARLESVSPLKVLARGYSISKHKTKVLKTITQIKKGDSISTQLSDGEFTAVVTNV